MNRRHLPHHEVAKSKGWTHQVQWTENENLCFVRCTSGASADEWVSKLKKQGHEPVVVDLADAALRVS